MSTPYIIVQFHEKKLDGNVFHYQNKFYNIEDSITSKVN